MTTLKIHNTEDYSLFDRVKGNRQTSKAHINKLAEAIKADPNSIKYNPIVVNERMAVIDGQHRLEALERLELPVYYIQQRGLTLKNVQTLNAIAKVWSPKDYAKSFAELGNKNYKTYLEFKRAYSLNHDILMRYLSLENPITGASFKEGKLVVQDETLSHDLCSKLLDLVPYHNRALNRNFALAFKMIWESNDYDHDRFVAKLKAKGMNDYGTREDYARAIEGLYNHGLPTSKRIVMFRLA